ncbi:MAG TPA: exodeoxyribonuclease VII large subunit [Saprospiraceae bacterium]|mgnify:FL=1|nr:exodeoxyribonuclease VII large subunit [Saprospiraceae bacterium]
MADPTTITLFQLQEFIRRVLALNLPDAVWVEAEIAELGQSRGHSYLSLVQKEENSAEPVATAQAVIWQNHLAAIGRKISAALLQELLAPGRQLRIKARIEHHERFGLKLVVEDIDPAYTIGQLELQRRQTLERLRAEQLTERNAALPTGEVLQRIAVVSSQQGAGYQDFIEHLRGNPYGYRYHCELFPAAVQGQNAEMEMSRSLERIARQAHRFDCTVIIRGGGARLDLGAFDGYDICRAIALHPLPVFTGIGHDVNESLADTCAQLALKTPTAVADFLIRRHLGFESRLLQLAQDLQTSARQRMAAQRLSVEQIALAVQRHSTQYLLQQNQQLALLHRDTRREMRNALQYAGKTLDQMNQLSVQLHPQATLERGFTITLKDGRRLRSAAELQPGDRIETIFADGSIGSHIATSTEP